MQEEGEETKPITILQLFVALRIDVAQYIDDPKRMLGVETLGYTSNKMEGLRFIETVVARDVSGKDWDFALDGDPFYDPENEDGAPPPAGRFPTWDEDDSEASDVFLDRPTSVIACASVYDEGPAHRLLRCYKLCSVNPMVSDFVKTHTEGDKEMERQVAESRTTAANAQDYIITKDGAGKPSHVILPDEGIVL